MGDTIAATTGGLSTWVQGAHDRLLYFGLRTEPVFRMVADVSPSLQTAPGSSVTFRFVNDLATATTPLTETSDVDRVDQTTTSVSVTVNEYGNAVGTTAKLRATGLMDVEAAQADLIAYNCVDSLDEVVRDVLVAGTNVTYGGAATSRVTVAAGHVIDSADIRLITARMRTAKVAPRRSGFFVTFVHPDVSHDLRAEAGTNAAWREAHVYASPDAIYAGEIGAYEGQVFIETPRARVFTDAGVGGTVDVYATLSVGQQALAEAVAIEPHIVQSPVVDRLRRFVSHGWYALIGWGRFREAAIRRLETSSSIGTNT